MKEYWKNIFNKTQEQFEECFTDEEIEEIRQAAHDEGFNQGFTAPVNNGVS